MRKVLMFLLNTVCLLSLPSCTEVECPLDSVVVMTCGLYDAESHDKLSSPQTLSITPAGKDTLLLNAAQDIQSFVLPLKMGATCDTMLLHFSDTWEYTVTDTIYIHHENLPHFESVECPSTIFHKINNVTWGNEKNSQLNTTIDSVVIVRPLVDYNDVENIQIYLHCAS
ncbi:MAG: hypothetical protein IKT82_06810 [Bacteroidaceae bacterium]|nr:hypothetical protein [Bacteroidaceae bacterium]